jgi:hypothetical protein
MMIMNWSSSSPPKLKRTKPLAFLFLGLIFLMIIPASAASLAYAKTSDDGSNSDSDGDKKKSNDKQDKDEGKKKKTKTKTDNDGGDNKKKKKEKTVEESSKKKEEPKCKPSCDDTTTPNPPDEGTATATSKVDGGTKKPLTKETTTPSNGPTTNSPDNCDTNANDCTGGTGTAGGGPTTLNCDSSSNDPNCAPAGGGGGGGQTPQVDCKKNPNDPSCSSTTNTTPSPQCDPDKDPKCTPSTPQQLVSNGGSGGDYCNENCNKPGNVPGGTETMNGVTIKHGGCNFNGIQNTCSESDQRHVDREACTDDANPAKEQSCLHKVECFYDKSKCGTLPPVGGLPGGPTCDPSKGKCPPLPGPPCHCPPNERCFCLPPPCPPGQERFHGACVPECPPNTHRISNGACERVVHEGGDINIRVTINDKTVIKNIIEGNQPIGSSANSSDITGKLFREFNNRTNAATGLVVTDTTMTKNQFVKGQIEITGHVQNMRPANSSSTTIGATRTASAASTNNNDINTARMTVVIATFYDSADNVINTQYGASDPNTLTPGQSGVFHLIVNNAANNIDHVTYLVQWLGISGGNGVLHPTTYEVKAAAATTFPAAK